MLVNTKFSGLTSGRVGGTKASEALLLNVKLVNSYVSSKF